MGIMTAQIEGQSLEVMDAVMDGTDVAARFGYSDAVEGLGFCPDAYFNQGTPEWYAYCEGYRTWRDEVVAVILTGAYPSDDRRHADLTYVPFQLDASAYADVLPDWQRDDYVGM